jgi:tetratricopeptide (TPR) repeat protein
LKNLNAENLELMKQTHDNVLALSHMFRLQGRWKDASTLLDGVLPVAVALGDAKLASHWNSVANTIIEEGYHRQMDTNGAQDEPLALALQHAQAAQDAALEGSVWNSKGYSLHSGYLTSDRSHKPEDELPFFERGLELRQQAGDVAGIAESSFYVGLTHQVLYGSNDTSLPYFEDSYRKAQEVNDKVTASEAIRHIGFVKYVNEKIPESRKDFLESLNLREEAGFIPGTASALVTLAEIECELDNQTEALKYFDRAKNIYASLDINERVSSLEERMAEL